MAKQLKMPDIGHSKDVDMIELVNQQAFKGPHRPLERPQGPRGPFTVAPDNPSGG